MSVLHFSNVGSHRHYNTTEAVADLWECPEETVQGEKDGAHWVLRRRRIEVKILNGTINIDVRNDEMTFEADTKLVEGASKTMEVVGAKRVDSPRVKRNEERTAQGEFRETHANRGNFVPQIGDEVGECRSRLG